MSRDFPSYDEHDAPVAARAGLAEARKAFGAIPAPLARYASSPLMMKTALAALDAFDQSSLEPLERDVLAITMGHVAGCRFCVALHRRRLSHVGAEHDLVQALEAPGPLPNERLEGLRRFVVNAFERRGDVDAETFARFREHGFSHQQALDALLGVGVYTLTTFANRLTETSET
jgi:AhpD family alkylhydroperoxidase